MLQEAEVLRLTREEPAAFVAALLDPPEPHEKRGHAMERCREELEARL